MLESTSKSSTYHVCYRRYEMSCKKVVDLDFQSHMQLGIFIRKVAISKPLTDISRN